MHFHNDGDDNDDAFKGFFFCFKSVGLSLSSIMMHIMIVICLFFPDIGYTQQQRLHEYRLVANFRELHFIREQWRRRNIPPLMMTVWVLLI